MLLAVAAGARSVGGTRVYRVWRSLKMARTGRHSAPSKRYAAGCLSFQSSLMMTPVTSPAASSSARRRMSIGAAASECLMPSVHQSVRVSTASSRVADGTRERYRYAHTATNERDYVHATREMAGWA